MSRTADESACLSIASSHPTGVNMPGWCFSAVFACAMQVAVAVMKRFEKDDYKHKTQAADAFAKQLLDNWGVGRAGCNNGVLLLLSVGDRQVHIATGAATLGLLTDDVLDTIIDNMKPALRDER